MKTEHSFYKRPSSTLGLFLYSNSTSICSICVEYNETMERVPHNLDNSTETEREFENSLPGKGSRVLLVKSSIIGGGESEVNEGTQYTQRL